MTLQEALARVVAGRTLSELEMAAVMERILGGNASAAQIAGLLVALRMRGETVGELVGAARTMAPPKAAPIAWWPRHTPRIGMVPAKRWMRGTEMPASRGVRGPGEMTTPSGRSAATSSRVIASLRRTSRTPPSSPRYWTRL